MSRREPGVELNLPEVVKFKVNAASEGPSFVGAGPGTWREWTIKSFVAEIVESKQTESVVPEIGAWSDFPVGHAGPSIKALAGSGKPQVVYLESRADLCEPQSSRPVARALPVKLQPPVVAGYGCSGGIYREPRRVGPLEEMDAGGLDACQGISRSPGMAAREETRNRSVPRSFSTPVMLEVNTARVGIGRQEVKGTCIWQLAMHQGRNGAELRSSSP